MKSYRALISVPIEASSDEEAFTIADRYSMSLVAATSDNAKRVLDQAVSVNEVATIVGHTFIVGHTEIVWEGETIYPSEGRIIKNTGAVAVPKRKR